MDDIFEILILKERNVSKFARRWVLFVQNLGNEHSMGFVASQLSKYYDLLLLNKNS
jgi:hypothetical protein